MEALEQFAEAGRGDVRKLQGRQSQWRLRVGDWRVILILNDPIGVIGVLRVLHRRESYR